MTDVRVGDRVSATRVHADITIRNEGVVAEIVESALMSKEGWLIGHIDGPTYTVEVLDRPVPSLPQNSLPQIRVFKANGEVNPDGWLMARDSGGDWFCVNGAYIAGYKWHTDKHIEEFEVINYEEMQ